MGDSRSKDPPSGPTWKARAANKRAAEIAKIPKEWRLAEEYLIDVNPHSDQNVLEMPSKCEILSSDELEITENYDVVSLAKAAQSGQLEAEAIAIAFCKRAAIAQQLCNCLTETFFDDAIKRGKWLDEYLEEHGRPVGPLHGVPISVKDCFHYAGTAATLGYVSFLDEPLSIENSSLLNILLDLGAILYCKTNVPQTLKSADSDNNLFGRVLNPHKLKLGAGGSSGGEGALIALRGSLLGIGTDIAGSIRIPSLCNGTYGYKPSSGRFPDGGPHTLHSRRGSPGFGSVPGPLAKSLKDMVFLTNCVLGMEPWHRDPVALPIPWRSAVASQEISPSNIRVGYFIEDPAFKIHPPVRRALDSTIQKLKSAGCTLIPLVDHPSIAEGESLVYDRLSWEPSPQGFMKILERSGEPLVESLQRTRHVWDKKDGKATVSDIFDYNAAAGDYIAAWRRLWNEKGLDVILCPGAQTTAVLHDEYGRVPYTAVWNLLEWPGIILPAGKADQSIDKDELASPDPERSYRAADVHGAPLAVQLVASKYKDEELFAIARAIDLIIKQ